tara:strand:+ start:1920 stop:2153 length:234 start_codon:yes stop_codon:yes gene_type:complete
VRSVFLKASEYFAGIFLLSLSFLYPVGVFYWLWLSIKLGSFWMFFLGISGPIVVFVGPLGLYALIFGTPDWIYNIFG